MRLAAVGGKQRRRSPRSCDHTWRIDWRSSWRRGLRAKQAIEQALAEFGDAAGLAGQFVAISQNRKRRWLVRLMTFSAAATLLIAASLVIFWPGRNAARCGDRRGPTACGKRHCSGSTEQPCRPLDPADRGWSLTSRPTLTFRTASEGCFPILSRTAPDSDLSKSKSWKKRRSGGPADHDDYAGSWPPDGARSDRDELELTYFVKDVLFITTPADEENNLETRVYDCRDLLAMPAPPVPQAPLSTPDGNDQPSGGERDPSLRSRLPVD